MVSLRVRTFAIVWLALLPGILHAAQACEKKYQAHWGANDCKSCKCWIDGVKLSDNADYDDCSYLLKEWVAREKPDESLVSQPVLKDKLLYFGGKPFHVIEVKTRPKSC